MRRELTITIDEDVYAELRQVVGEPEMGRFIESLVRVHVLRSVNQNGSVVDLLAMPAADDVCFDPPRLDTELYRKSELI